MVSSDQIGSGWQCWRCFVMLSDGAEHWTCIVRVSVVQFTIYNLSFKFYSIIIFAILLVIKIHHRCQTTITQSTRTMRNKKSLFIILCTRKLNAVGDHHFRCFHAIYYCFVFMSFMLNRVDEPLIFFFLLTIENIYPISLVGYGLPRIVPKACQVNDIYCEKHADEWTSLFTFSQV